MTIHGLATGRDTQPRSSANSTGSQSATAKMVEGGNISLENKFLIPPKLSAVPKDVVEHRRMERTVSMDMRSEREDLKEAAEQSMNVILDLGLDGLVRWVSPSWKDVIGYSIENIKGKPISDIVVDDAVPSTIFADAVDSMKKDDSRSQIIRFTVRLGPDSILRSTPEESLVETQSDAVTKTEQEDQYLNLEGQGIMVYDRSSGGESHVSILDLKKFMHAILNFRRQCG